jgi:hypothetical protein
MIIELAAGYGAMRCLTDVWGWVARRNANNAARLDDLRQQQQARQQGLVPVQGNNAIMRDPGTGRFQPRPDGRARQAEYEPAMFDDHPN